MLFRKICVAALLFPALNPLAASPTYTIRWTHPNSHYLEITMTLDAARDSVDIALPVWRPGRYFRQDFAKNIVGVSATDLVGKPLPVRKIERSRWRLAVGPQPGVVVQYRYYARQLDAGESYVDDAEVYVNPVTCLMYVPGGEMRPVLLKLAPPAGWRTAIAADMDSAAGGYRFNNYHDLVDAPLLMSPDLKRFTFELKGAEIDVAVQGEANYQPDSLLRDIRAIVTEQSDIMGGVPFERYLFLYHFVPFAIRHGVEHQNSTSIVIGPPDFTDPKYRRGFLGVTSHEFFHVWNVERIRPAAIYWPDYSQENYTTTMWMYEGVTSYYGDLTLVRAGLTGEKKYFSRLARAIKRYKNTYGRHVTSVTDVSWDSWMKGMGNAPPNTYYSYYLKGELIGLLLDLEIRHRTGNKKSLDHVMRALNKAYARRGMGVPENGVQATVQSVTGLDFSNFFRDYVHGTAEIDFNAFLGQAGLELTARVADNHASAGLGIALKRDAEQAVISNVRPGSPADLAGLDTEDILLAIDGKRVRPETLDLLLRAYAPGDTVNISIFHRDQLRSHAIALEAAEPDEYKIQRLKKTTKAQDRIRKGWLKASK